MTDRFGGLVVEYRSDISSLGATLYELVCGLPPFDGGTLAELSANILTKTAASVRTRKGGEAVPEGLADVIARCLEREPAKRFATAEPSEDRGLPRVSGRASASVAPTPSVASPSKPSANPLDIHIQ